ncbi:hypothetical protein Cadr_000025140 [Camelus dromedarius]|uniref:Uncharacterized protein n=1 Tax=Camelus dromedarius TaxID=9838 RepID=A0A5N4CME6_CAMDR|nr:hypothetical protein Cadr_000025140 [Camelus dromedarius]
MQAASTACAKVLGHDHAWGSEAHVTGAVSCRAYSEAFDLQVMSFHKMKARGLPHYLPLGLAQGHTAREKHPQHSVLHSCQLPSTSQCDLCCPFAVPEDSARSPGTSQAGEQGTRSLVGEGCPSLQGRRKAVMQGLVGLGEDVGFYPQGGGSPGGLWAEGVRPNMKSPGYPWDPTNRECKPALSEPLASWPADQSLCGWTRPGLVASALKGLLCARHGRMRSPCVCDSQGPGLHLRGGELPARGALPKLKHDFLPCLSSRHLAPFSWVLAGLSACARCDWRRARALREQGKTERRGPGSNQNTVIHSTDIYPSPSCQQRRTQTDRCPWGERTLVNRSVGAELSSPKGIGLQFRMVGEGWLRKEGVWMSGMRSRPGRGHDVCKGPEAGLGLPCCRDVEEARGKREKVKSRQGTRRSCRALAVGRGGAGPCSGARSREDGQLGARTGVEDWLELSRPGGEEQFTLWMFFGRKLTALAEYRGITGRGGSRKVSTQHPGPPQKAPGDDSWLNCVSAQTISPFPPPCCAFKIPGSSGRAPLAPQPACLHTALPREDRLEGRREQHFSC